MTITKRPALHSIHSKGRGTTIAKKLYHSRYLYLLMLLPAIYFILFKYKPMYGILIAFKKYRVKDGIWGSKWVGSANFAAFLQDEAFWSAFGNTISLSLLQIIICFPIPIIFALLVNEVRSKRLRGLVERVSCFPHFISMVMVVSLLVSFVSKDGLVNQMVAAVGGTPKSLLLDPQWFRPLYIICDIWQEGGWSAIIYLAALSNVDLQLYEACDIDGGGRWVKLWHITLPSIISVITIMLILRMGSIMTLSFDKVLLMQNTNTYATSDVIATYVYRRGLIGAQYEFATAVGLMESLICLGFLLLTNCIANKISDSGLF